MDQKEVIQIITDAIVDSAKKDWLNANLEIKVLGASINSKLRFEYVDNPIGWEFLADQSLVAKAVMNYHQLLHETGNSKWNKMLVKLYPTGKFDIDFQWDQELQDEYEDNSRV
jgi:hypothetical protein